MEQPMLLPGPTRYPRQLFKLNLGNNTSLEMEIRAFVAMHYAARISWQHYSDQSELVRVGPSASPSASPSSLASCSIAFSIAAIFASLTLPFSDLLETWAAFQSNSVVLPTL